MRKLITMPRQEETFVSASWPAILVLVFSVLGAAWLQFRPVRDEAPLLSIFSPLTSENAALAATIAAGGKIIAKSPLPFALIVQSDDPDFIARMRRAGAWLLLDATGRGLCRVFP